MTTPRNRTTTALWKSWVTHLHFTAKPSLVSSVWGGQQLPKNYKTSNSPTGCTDCPSSSSPIPDKECTVRPKQTFGQPDRYKPVWKQAEILRPREGKLSYLAYECTHREQDMDRKQNRLQTFFSKSLECQKHFKVDYLLSKNFKKTSELGGSTEATKFVQAFPPTCHCIPLPTLPQPCELLPFRIEDLLS